MSATDDRLWRALKALLEGEGETPGLTVDAVGTALLRRDASLMGEDESVSAFLRRVEEELRRHGVLNGTGQGATVRALTTAALREKAGLSLAMREAVNDVADQLLRATPGSGVPCLRPPTAAGAALSLIDRAGDDVEHTRVADMLLCRRGG
jgi:hypothetical protein